MAEPAVRGMVKAVVVSGVMDKLPDQNEHRDHRQPIAGENIPDLRADHPQRGRPGGHIGDSAKADDRHREAGRDPQQEKGGEHDGDPDDAQQRPAHRFTSSVLPKARGMSRRQVRASKAKPAATPKTKG